MRFNLESVANLSKGLYRRGRCISIVTLAFVATALASNVGAQATAASPARPTASIKTDTLTSKFAVAGIPVILRQVTANNVVAANLYLLGGVRQLTPETQGLEAQLLESPEAGTKE